MNSEQKCGAFARSTGSACKAPPVKGKIRCRVHGGLSSGPTSLAGLQAVGKATRQRMASGQQKRALEGFLHWLNVAGGRERLSKAAKDRIKREGVRRSNKPPISHRNQV